jgi:hypothetical protein
MSADCRVFSNSLFLTPANIANFFSRIVLAPFFYVGFADFWLADQLNSLGQAVKDFKYLGSDTLRLPRVTTHLACFF